MPLSASFVAGNQEPANISGGTASFIGNGADRLKALTFTSNSSITFNEHGAIKHILLVGGGGSGGDSSIIVSNPAGLRGGGGGGGEVKILSDVFTWELTGGDDTVSSTAVTIGAGGTGPISAPPSNNGQATSIGPYSAAGGGGGSGNSGGSGGGGAGWDNLGSSGSATASGYQSFGSAGGSSSNGQHGAGGGGATQAGANGSAGGKGGDGYTWSVNSTTYGGGGGGGDNVGGTSAGSGGAGGTGGGGWGRGDVPSGGSSQHPITGTNGLGGGGGAGGQGGSGVVVLVVEDPVAPVLTYSLSGSPSSVVEGNTSVFTVATGNVNSGTDLYWTVNNITTADNDFVSTSGNITIQSDAATFNVDTVSGNVSGTETFNVSLRTGSVSGTIVATSNTVSITEFVPAGSYPNYPSMPTYSEWQTASNLISSGGSETYAYEFNGTTSGGTNSYQYAGSLPNGNVIVYPRSTNTVLEYSNSAGTYAITTLTGVSSSDVTHQGGAISTHNSNVYLCPNNKTNIIEIDPTNYSATAISISGMTNGYGAYGLRDGRIIMKPDSGSYNHYVYDPSDGSYSSTNIANNGIPSGFAHPPMVQHPKDNIVYLPPYRFNVWKKWDPSTDTYSTITLSGGSDSVSGSNDRYQDAVLGVDGKIYCTPWSSADIGIFDIDTNTYTRHDPSGNITGRYGRGALGADGRVYMFPSNTNDVLSIDTDPDSAGYQTHRIESVSSIFTGNCWGGSIAGDGKIIAASSTSGALTIQTTGANTINHAYFVSPYNNND